MTLNATTAQDIYVKNYQFAKPPEKPNVTAVPGDQKVTLYWDDIAESSFDPITESYDFCQKFIDLCFDIYVNKTKLHLIKPVIEYCFQNDVCGGVSDMVLFYLLRKDVQNLNIPFDGGVFMHNLNIGEGWQSKSQYELIEDSSGNSIINITKNDNSYQIYDTINNKYYNLYSIHFQGQAKKHLRNIEHFLT